MKIYGYGGKMVDARYPKFLTQGLGVGVPIHMMDRPKSQIPHESMFLPIPNCIRTLSQFVQTSSQVHGLGCAHFEA
jgi:hypothetical protein